MNKYTIYCTKEQTLKALELGAPIKKAVYADFILYENIEYIVDKENGFVYLIPTAEQMIGWLEEKDITVKIVKCDTRWFARPCSCKNTDFNRDGYFSRKEAILAAIDSALDYLTYLSKTNKYETD